MKNLILFLIILFNWFTLFSQTSKSKTIDNGGSGPFKAIAVSDISLPDYVVYRPSDLKQVKKEKGSVPLFIFANGACHDSSVPYERFLSELASQGYIVIGLGEFQYEHNDREVKTTKEKMIPKAIDWALSKNADKDSEYYEIISTDKIATGGHSCGGADALSVAADPRVKTYLIFNAGMGDISMFGATPESLKDLHAPIIYIVGGVSDIAYENAQKDYDRISHVPVVFTNLTEGGHSGTFAEEYGGEFSKMTIDWFDFIFNKKDNSDIFIEGDLKNYPGWTLSSKNFKEKTIKSSSDLKNTNINPELTSKIDSTLQAMVDNGKISCVSAFVGKSGDIVYNKSFGYKDIENKIGRAHV